VKLRLLLLALSVLIPMGLGRAERSTQYLSPGELALSPDGRLLYVLCERSDEVRIVDLAKRQVIKSVAVGHAPHGIAVTPDGTRMFVTNSWDDTVSVIDTARLEVVGTIRTGFEPWGVAVVGGTLYVANRVGNDISVIDLPSGRERKRLLAGRGVSYFSLSPDGTRLYATHVYPNIAMRRGPPQSEITVIDTVRQNVAERVPLNNIAGVFHAATSHDGAFTVVPQLQPKNLVPMAHVEHGFVFGNSLTVTRAGVAPITAPLDELERYYSYPFGVAIAPDGFRIYVSHAGSDVVSVVSTKRLFDFADSRKGSFSSDLSASANYVLARIPVGHNPRGILLSNDGKQLFVTNRMDDTIAIVDTDTNRLSATIDLGGPQEIKPLRKGEIIFNSAKYAFQGHMACANCHIDGTFDGMEWDLEPDGFGKDVVDNRLIEDLPGTEPFKWNGGNPDMPTECGPRTQKFIYRAQSFNASELADVVSFVQAMPPRPNRFRTRNGELTPAQERGKAIYVRMLDKTGQAIPERNQCAFCHSGPKYTNQKQFDVGTGKATDRSPVVDTPQLVNVYMTAPYLHDGSAHSLEEIWTVFNPDDKHGRTNDLTKDELNDLIEYLRTL
jgi:YVTN family beta-propeller protein